MKYIIALQWHPSRGIEEYDGGNTLSDARKEAWFFRQSPEVSKHVEIRICIVTKAGKLETVERVP